MKKIILGLVLTLMNCTNSVGLDVLQMGGISLDTSAITELVAPTAKNLIAGLTPEEAAGVVVLANLEEPEPEEPPPPPWQPESRWVYMFGADGNLIVDGDFRYEERVADDIPFELRLRMYILQAEQMNRTVDKGGDPRCWCTVRHGGPGGGI